MPTDSVKNIERAFTGRVPILTMTEDYPLNQVFEIINYRDILSKIKPAGAVNVNLSVALETLQLISYLPGLFRPNKFPDYDEDLIPLLQKQAEDLQWMAEFNPSTQYALEISLYESWWFDTVWGDWDLIARKWLYNQQTEYYLDLLNPFLTITKNSDIGDPNYKLGIAITQKPTQQTAKANENYIRIRAAYSGIITYEQPGINPKQLLKNSGSYSFTELNVIASIIDIDRFKRVIYLQNTGKSIVYFNFDYNLTSSSSPFLLPGETLTYENGEFKWTEGGIQFFPPVAMAEYLLQQTGVYVYCQGKDKDGKTQTENSVAWIVLSSYF